MTDVIDAEAAETTETEAKRRGRKPGERDFTKFTDDHQGLANFVNADPKFVEAGIESVTPNQVKAILALRTDYNDTPERKALKEERKAAREAEKAEFAGMDPEQVKAEKAARRAEKQAEKMQARVAEALAKAQAIREGRDASGADLAAAVEAQQNGAETGKRKLSRNRA